MEKKRIDLRVVKYLLLAAVLVLVIRYFDVLAGGVGNLWSIAMPLLIGCVVAYVLNIVLRFLEKHYFPNSSKKIVQKSKRPLCIVLSLVLIIVAFVLVFYLVIPELAEAIQMIGASIPMLVDNGTAWVIEHEDQFPDIANWLESLEPNWEKMGNNILDYLKSGIDGVLNSTVTIVTNVVSSVVNFAIGLVFGIYILASKEKLAVQIKRLAHAYVKPKWIAVCKQVLTTANETFSSFIVGQVTEAVILGSLCTIGMLIFCFPYAPTIGAFIGVTALVPIIGAYLGAAVGFLLILTQNPLQAVLFIVFIVILQQLEGNLIYPKVVGSSIGLPGMWVFAAVTIGGGLLGIPGMLLGVPLAATIYKLLAQNVRRRQPAKPC